MSMRQVILCQLSSVCPYMWQVAHHIWFIQQVPVSTHVVLLYNVYICVGSCYENFIITQSGHFSQSLQVADSILCSTATQVQCILSVAGRTLYTVKHISSTCPCSDRQQILYPVWSTKFNLSLQWQVVCCIQYNISAHYFHPCTMQQFVNPVVGGTIIQYHQFSSVPPSSNRQCMIQQSAQLSSHCLIGLLLSYYHISFLATNVDVAF